MNYKLLDATYLLVFETSLNNFGSSCLNLWELTTVHKELMTANESVDFMFPIGLSSLVLNFAITSFNSSMIKVSIADLPNPKSRSCLNKNLR